MKRILLTTTVCLAFFALAATCSQTPPPEAGLTANPVYQKNCAKCHGKGAGGRHFGGPSLISERSAPNSTEDLRNIIANGKGHMPKFASKLPPAEIDALVQQIQAASKK